MTFATTSTGLTARSSRVTAGRIVVGLNTFVSEGPISRYNLSWYPSNDLFQGRTC
jgi:hypothetical protein